MEYIALDCHKRYIFAAVEDERGRILWEGRIPNERGAIREFLGRWTPGSPVAVETVGNWYTIVDQVEEAGFVARLVHAGKAKLMLGMVNKTDKLDARGLNKLQRTGTLPEVWIPPGELRDMRELPRTRMVLVRERTRLKQRIHATLAKYGIRVEASDLFGVQGKQLLREHLGLLPPQTRYVTEGLLGQIEALDGEIGAIEGRMREVLSPTREVELLQTLPGVGFILAVVIALEVGDVGRFPDGEHLASYAGMVPRVHASGGKARYGRTRQDVNRYLKWAYSEAGNVVARYHRVHPQWHVSRLYARIRGRSGHQVAVVAVGRHLAEASYWMLRRGEPYRDPKGCSGKAGA
jgi:transposase